MRTVLIVFFPAVSTTLYVPEGIGPLVALPSPVEITGRLVFLIAPTNFPFRSYQLAVIGARSAGSRSGRPPIAASTRAESD